MARTRVSTTVDEELLRQARRAVGATDAVMLDEALRALLARQRSTEIDAAYDRAYTEHPLSEPDEWGDLASWNEAAARS